MSHKVEFGTKALADQYREEQSEYICSDDDARLRTVEFVEDTPESILERARLEAQEGLAEREGQSVTASLTPGERARISELGGFDQTTSIFNWRSAKGVFAREGLMDKFHDAMGALTDYDDPAEGAEEWIAQGREADAREGTKTVSGGARDEGVQEAQVEEKIAKQSRQAQAGQCNHAEDHCRHGDPEACEFLTEVCGFDEDEVDEILEDVDEGQEVEIEGQALGALKRAWQGYKGGISQLDDDLEGLREAWGNAQAAARAINRVREAHGQERIHFERLEELQAELVEWADRATEDCHECHVGLDRAETLDGPTDQEADEIAPIEGPGDWIGPEIEDKGGVKWRYERGRMDGGEVILMVTQQNRGPYWEVRAGYLDYLEAVRIGVFADRERAIEVANGWLRNQGRDPPQDPDQVVQIYESDMEGSEAAKGRIISSEKLRHVSDVDPLEGGVEV